MCELREATAEDNFAILPKSASTLHDLDVPRKALTLQSCSLGRHEVMYLLKYGYWLHGRLYEAVRAQWNARRRCAMTAVCSDRYTKPTHRRIVPAE